MVTRVGLGVDAHAFDEDRPLVLGGARIAGSPGLAGHSDADVVSHAIADALLGAAGMGDIGVMFPDDDRWRGASSLEILEEAARAVRAEHWSICNVDATVVAQRPHLAPHRDAMVSALAGALGIAPSDVWVKATTTDGMGFTGRAEGIAAIAVALVQRL